MLWINSRARDMILRSGENIYPIEIEHRLAEHPAVAEVAVVGIDHDVLGQEVKAVVVPVAGASVEPAELAAFAAATLSSYKVPSQWEIRRDALPRNAAGKVLKSELT
jgi:acyl-CoA synthetase (AMP-forming)/AMP-acid ligase II